MDKFVFNISETSCPIFKQIIRVGERLHYFNGRLDRIDG